MQQLVTRINEKDPAFLTMTSDWFLYERYKSPPQWEAITKELLPPSTTSIKDLLDLADASDFLNSEPLTLLLLDVLADRLVRGSLKGEPVTIQNTNIDMMLAQIIINKTLIEEGPEVEVIKAPMNALGNYSAQVNNNAIFLCPTAAAKMGCCFTINGLNNTFDNYILIEQQVSTAKWLYSHSYMWTGTVLSTDISSDLRYQLFLKHPDNDPNKFTFAVVDNVVNNHAAVNAAGYIMRQGRASDVSFIFEDNGYNFYMKIDNDVYKSNAKKIYDTKGQQGLLLQPTSMDSISDLFIRKYLNKQNSVCRCLEQKQKEKFNTRVLHTYTYSDKFLVALKKFYNTDFNIIQTACNQDAFNHVLLLKNTQNANQYHIARISFAPDKRIQPLLDCMNKLPTDDGTLYANALCAHYMYASKWTLSTQDLEGKMGVLYNSVDPCMKTIIQNTLPSSLIGRSTVRVQQAFKHYGAFIKRNMGLLKLPAIAAAVVGGVGLATTYPFATLLSIPLGVSVGARWASNYQKKHALTAPVIKEWLVTGAIVMLMIPILYWGESKGRIGFNR